jgi:SOS-response transcriptional repressor LexA
MTTLGQRLERARERAAMKQRDVAEHFGISSQAISQWEADRTRPDSQRLAALARLFAVRLDWLLAGEGPMADGTEGAGSPRESGTPVPVIDRVQAGDWTEVHDPYAAGGGEDYLLTDLPVSPNTFALVVEGTSMAPDFQPGDKVIIDPALAPRPGDLVVAKRDKDQEATFKKYRLRGKDERGRDVIELAPLNPDWPALLIDADNPGHIIGTMIEHRRYRRG